MLRLFNALSTTLLPLRHWLLAASCLLAALGWPTAACAQRWQRDSLLSQVQVTQLVRGPAGFIWVGTDADVQRYDGYELVPLHRLRRRGAALPRGLITGLVADQAGTLWIGQEAGLYRFWPATGELRLVPLPGVAPGQVPDVTLLWQHPRTGQVWVSYGDGRLLALGGNGQPAAAASWRLPRPGRWLATDSAGPGLWATTDGGLLFRLLPGRVAAVAGWPGRYLLPVPDTRPQQFVSTHALYTQDPRTGSLRECQRWGGPGLEEGFQPLLLPGGRWELATQQQVVALRWPAAGGYPAVALGPAPQRRRLSTPLKYVVQATADGLHWAYSRGARGCAKRRAQAEFLTPLAGPAGEVYSTRPLTRLPDGRLLVGGYGPTLAQAAGQPLGPLRPLQPTGPKAVPRILYGLLTVGPHVYYAEENHGFGELLPGTGQLVPFEYISQAKPLHANAQVLLHDHRGRLWGGARAGLWQLDPKTHQARPYATGPAAAWLAKRDVRALAEDARGHFWLATEEGLADLEPASGRLQRYATGQPARFNLPTNDVLSLYAPPTGPLWLGTRDQGLLQLTPGRGLTQQYTLGTGLLSPTVVAVLPGLGSEVWAATYVGLVRVRPARRQCSVYTMANGLRDNEFNRQAAWRDPDGTLYFGGVGGLHRVVPARAPADPPSPRLLLTGTTRYLPDAPPTGLTEPAAAAQPLRLPPGTHYTAWHLALSDYLAPHDASFQGQLLDEDDRVVWQATTPHTLLLPLPPPGRYTLRLSGQTAQGVRAASQLHLPLVVDAWWWQHPVAWTLATAALLAAAYGLHRRRLVRAVREAQLRTRIATDLHDEVGTLLTRVSVQAELLSSLPPEHQAPAVANLLRNSRAAASTMRDVVWGIDARADSAGSLLDRMREYLHQTAAAAGWHTELEVSGWSDDAPLPPTVRQGVYRIFKEAVTNAVRHARGATCLRVRLERQAGQLGLVVADDGPPPPARAQSATGMGLPNMRQRAAALGGQLTAAAEPAGGFVVRLWVPLEV